ncbi:MAG: hypothetical protein IME96_11920 [Proteobacteria bacterium]|nr:hypothetical protein [Pseudomonadota bacterium]
MSSSNLLLQWSSQAATSILIWIVIAVILLYAARKPAHELIFSLCRLIHNALRVAGRSIMIAEKKLADRNREVLLAAGEESVQRLIEREFHRVNAVVSRDLSGYPAFQRSLKDQITRIDEDYQKSVEIPPSPPGWMPAVEAVAKIPPTGDTMVANILKDINKSIDKQHNRAIEEYRKASTVRHTLLKKMMPFWRKMSNTLDEVDKTISGLLERSKFIDSKMEEYEQIRKGSDKAVRTLSSSSMTQFVISGFVLLIAIGGAVINFNLIALPMSEMVGGSSYIGGFKTSNVAAMVIILVEVAMGLFLMESLHITKLFPIIGSMDDKMRRRMVWISFSILFILAGIESSLAYMRDIIAADMQALRQSLADVTASGEVSGSWIPTAGQMIMGFILPFALTFIAIPLESFIHSSRTVLGVCMVGLLRVSSFLLRLFGNISRSAGVMSVAIYDLIVFAPLWFEGHLRGMSNKKGEKADTSVEHVENGEIS